MVVTTSGENYFSVHKRFMILLKNIIFFTEVFNTRHFNASHTIPYLIQISHHPLFFLNSFYE